jgi:hypothetical protein
MIEMLLVCTCDAFESINIASNYWLTLPGLARAQRSVFPLDIQFIPCNDGKKSIGRIL